MVVWSYPRGPNLDRAAETALDICAYATQMAALMGANIIKVKPPTAVISLEAAKKSYEKIDGSTMAKRVEHVMQCAFNGRRVVVFSGGEAKDLDGVFEEVRGLCRLHPAVRREVGRPEREPLHPRAGAADLLDVRHAPGGLEDGVHEDRPRQAGARLELGEEPVDVVDVLGALRPWAP